MRALGATLSLHAARALQALATLAGGRCLVCRAWCGPALCAPCLRGLAVASPRCARCGLRIPAHGMGGTACAGPACRLAPDDDEGWSTVVAATDYVAPVDALVAGFKFQGRLDTLAALAPLLQAAVADDEDRRGVPPPDLVVPVPLAPSRLRQRGYNQAWELARRVAAARGCAACPDALFRVRDTPAQHQLSRAARAANVHDAFVACPRRVSRVRGARVALVDDVLTTGATALAASRALRRAGASEVRLWVLARTP